MTGDDDPEGCEATLSFPASLLGLKKKNILGVTEVAEGIVARVRIRRSPETVESGCPVRRTRSGVRGSLVLPVR